MKKTFGFAVFLTIFFCLLNAANAWEQGDYFLEFNPEAYITEFFYEDGELMGSCPAAAIVLVEAHCELEDCIPSNAVANKNKQMVKNFGNKLNSETGYYEFTVSNMIEQLKKDGYNAGNRTVSSEEEAKDVILEVLSEEHWLIVLCRYGITTTGYNHFYPLYGAYWNGNISTSSVNLIDSFNLNYDPNNPNWDVMYRKGVSMKALLDSILSASDYGYYNFIEVW